jgi:hypothetical protein
MSICGKEIEMLQQMNKKTGATSENSEKNAFTAWRLMEVMAVWQQQS